MAAEQAKDRGNRAFTAGNYRDAVSSFTEAIALHDRAVASGDASGQPHVYFSNRSAAHLKLGDASSALADADKCVSLKRDFVKGYSRKGAALYALARFPDAFRAYSDGLKLDASNAALREGLQAVQTRLSAPSGSSGFPAAPRGASAATAAPSAGSKTLRQFVAGDKTAMFQALQFALRCMLVLTFVLYWLPLVLPAGLAFTTFFKVALFNYGSYLLFTHGRPQWNAAYGQRLVLDPTVQAFFYCLVFWVSAPYGLAMVPVLLVEMVHFIAYLASLLQVLKLHNASFVQTATTKALLPLTATILSEPTFASLPTASKWARLNLRVPQVAANVEVAIGISLLVELLTPARNFLLVMLFWQQLRVRYMISPPLQDAFRSLDASILSVTSHPRCPGFVSPLYAKLRAFAASMTALQQPGAPTGGGLASRCSVM